MRRSAAGLSRYSVAGIGLASELPFPDLAVTQAEPDVLLRLGKVEYEAGEPTPGPNWLQIETPGDWILAWEDVGTIRLRGGRELWIEPRPGLEEDRLRATVLGSLLSLLLVQRGSFPLHASSVVIAGQAVAIMGPSGAGKSSLAAALTRLGCAFLADDVSAIDLPGEVGGEAPLVHPGIPRFKLASATLETLGESPADHPRLRGEDEKHAVPAPAASVGAVPLGRLYEIADDDQDVFEPMTPQAAMLAVLRNCHRLDLGSKTVGHGELMARSARIAQSVPVFRLGRRRRIEGLTALARKLLAHASS